MKEKKKRSKIVSVIEENNKTYFLCDNNFIYEAKFQEKKMRKLDEKEDKEIIEKIMSRYKKPKYDVIGRDTEI